MLYKTEHFPLGIPRERLVYATLFQFQEKSFSEWQIG